MDHATQVALSKLALAHIDAGTTDLAAVSDSNPVETYTSRDILRHEQEVLFGKFPQIVALSCQIPDAGDYLTEDRGGVPILVTRNKDGQIRAFLNVCRHRGARVAEGSGNQRRLICPYHAWSYDLNGKLAGVPHGKEAFPELDKDCRGLTPLPVEEKYGMIWVTPSPANGSALAVEQHMAGLGPELENYGFAGYHYYDGREMRLNFNWKIVIDTFLEPYHFGYLHKYTVGPIFVPNLCLFHPFGLNLRETLPRRTIVEMKQQPESDWDLVKHTALVYVLFPNSVVIMQADHLETWRVYPIADKPDECVTVLDFYIPEPAETDSARRHWDRNMDLTIATVADEDFPTSEGIQRGFRSGAQSEVLYGRNEPALIHWQSAVKKALRAAG